MIRKYLGADRAYHHTAPISMNYALHEGLRLVLEEGLEARWARHLRNHRALKAGLTALGLPYTAAEGRQLPQLNAVRIPAGVDDLAVRKMLLNEFGIEIGGGLGDFKGKAWRIGLMGYNSRPDVVLLVLAALEQCLQKVGREGDAGGFRGGGERDVCGAVTADGASEDCMTARPMLPFGELVLERMVRAVEKVRERLLRATAALDAAGVLYAVIGGNAVAPGWPESMRPP